MQNPFRKSPTPHATPTETTLRQTAAGGKMRKRGTRMLRLDSWIDTAMYEASFSSRERWENITIFFRRMRVRGFWRGFFEIASEGFTLMVAGFVLLLSLALPAFEETAGTWQTREDFAVTFLDRRGNEIGRRGILHRDAVPIDELPDHFVKAVLATEDRRFFEHYGIDFLGLARAMTENVKAEGIVQGGSSITQQTAKNIFLSNERTVERKIKEAFLAVWLEVNFSKKEILKLYLDRAYMGGGTFGAAAAADFYFGKSIRDVTLSESAMMAGLFKSPTRYAPHVNLPAARGRANEVLTNLVQSGFLSEGQVAAARRNPASIVDRGETDSPDYFLDWAFEEVQRLTAGTGQRSMIARTTIDLDLQRAAEEAIEFHLRQFGKASNVTQSAAVLLDNEGAVRAMVGGVDYGASQFNRATRALRQPGSSFKPFVYATAMENGYDPASKITDKPITIAGWTPRNYSRGFSGRVDLTRALVKSINTVPVRLAAEIGRPKVAELATAMGVESPIRTDKTMPLGTSELTVMDMATAYAVFPAGGFTSNRHGITEIVGYDGNPIYRQRRDDPKPVRVLSEKAAADMNLIMSQIPQWGTGRRAALTMTTAAGKTGTTQSYRDAWFVGYTGNYTAAVWFGNDNYSPTNNVTGGSLPAMTWKRLMTFAHQNIEIVPIPGIEQPPASAAVEEEVLAEGEVDTTPARPLSLSEGGSDVLKSIAKLFETAAALSASTQLDASMPLATSTRLANAEPAPAPTVE